MTLRVFAHGGGTQSTAALVLSARGEIDFPVHLFCNVGDDSEDPATLEYVDKFSKPYAAEHGIELTELRRHRRDGSEETLMGRLTKEGSRSLPIPVRMSNGAPGTRSCTADFKIRVIAKEVKARGASAEHRVTLGIGITVDEIQRANNRIEGFHESVVYPLLDLGLRRSDCHRIIQDAGLPLPPKSSCFFCPFHRPQVWSEMRRDRPELFEKAAALEDLLNGRRDTLGKDHVYFTRFARPLRDAIGAAQDELPLGDSGMDDEGCDEGVCFT